MVNDTTPRSRSWKRALAVLAVVVFWGVMMTLQVRREIGHRPADDLDSTPVVRTESFFLAELADGSTIGSFHVVQEPEEREGRTGGVLQMEANLQLTLLGRPAELALEGSVWRPLVPDEILFSFRVATGEHDFEVSGRAGGGELKGAVQTAGESLPFSYPVGDELLVTGGLDYSNPPCPRAW